MKLPHHIVNTPQFASLKGSPLKLLIDLGCQYNGRNNGDLAPSLLRESGRWKSESTMTYAIDKLAEDGWVLKTKQGGMGIGPDLYAITWWPIDACKTHDMPAESVPSNLWAKKSPHRNPVLVTPESGASRPENQPEIGRLTPESGAVEAVFKAA